MEAESADLKETQMMINHDEKIYQEYIRALLFDTEQASLPRDQLSGKSEELANSLEYLGECVKEEQRILTQMADGDLSGSCRSKQSSGCTNKKHSKQSAASLMGGRTGIQWRLSSTCPYAG